MKEWTHYYGDEAVDVIYEEKGIMLIVNHAGKESPMDMSIVSPLSIEIRTGITKWWMLKKFFFLEYILLRSRVLEREDLNMEKCFWVRFGVRELGVQGT